MLHEPAKPAVLPILVLTKDHLVGKYLWDVQGSKAYHCLQVSCPVLCSV